MNQQKALETLRRLDKMAGRNSLITISTEVSQNGQHDDVREVYLVRLTDFNHPSYDTKKHKTLSDAMIEAVDFLVKAIVERQTICDMSEFKVES